MRNNVRQAMKTTVLYLAVLGCAFASPNGYYHQEYNYKTSSSAYRNNELQHQTDDQGYYRKDGDLEGRVRPKVDANSEHSEYINPNLRTGEYNTGLIGGANGDISSYGHMRANVGAYNSHDQSAESLAHSDSISGNRGAYSGYTSGAYGGSSYGSGSQSYSVASNLRTVTSHLQQELERDLQRAIQENRGYSELERELRQNLTSRLDNELVNRYGQQSIRGGLSYTLSGGRLHSTANYDNQELLDLRRNLETSLLNQLRTRYNQVYSGNRYTYSTTSRPYYPQYITTTYRPFTTVRPQYIDNSNYVRYTPTANQESITTIAARVQNQLDTRLNQILEDVQRTHFSSSSAYSLTNAEALLERLRNELRSNVTYLLEEDIRRNYGSQIQRDGHVYSVGPGGQTSSQYTYSVRDLENLRSQIERNLIEKLNRDFERYRTSWHQQYRQSGYSSQNSYRDYSTTPRYAIYTTPYTPYTPRYDVYSTPSPQYNIYDADVEHLSNRPSSNHLTSLITGSGGSSSQSQYLAGSGQSGYEVSGSRSMSQLQRQLQQDLSSQLQAALNRGQYGYYSSSGSYNPQSYQASLQQLTEELNRNLTRQLQEYSSSSYYSTYGNIDQAQLSNLRNQLQADLMRQLQQGLQQSYHSSSSYSASSSSSSGGSYRPARGFQNYQLGQYKTGGNVALMQGEDCVGDDPNAYTNHRIKRSYQPYRSQPIGLSQSGYNNYRGYNSYRTLPQAQVELGQETDDTDLTQQVEEPGYGKLQLGSQNQQQIQLGQQVDNSDLTQQPESEDLRLGSQGQQIDKKPVQNDHLTQQVETGFGRLHLGSQQSQQQTGYGQQEDNSDLTQQVEDIGNNKYDRLRLGSQQSQRQTGFGQQEDNSDLTQQTEDNGFGKLQIGSHLSQQQTGYGQQEDNSDLTQQTEDSRFGKLQIGSQQSQQQTGYRQQEDNSDLTQQTEDNGFGKLQIGSQQNQRQTGYGQQEDNSDLTQQTEDTRFGKLQIGSQQSQQQTGDGQQEDNSDLTQQTEDNGFGKLQIGSQQNQRQTGYGQQEDNSDLTQQTEDTRFGKLQIGSQQSQQQTGYGQQEDNSDLTQQTEDNGFGKLQIGSQQNQRQTGYGQQEDNSDLTQQTEDTRFGKLQIGSQQSQQQTGYGQQEDNSDLTQQTEDTRFGKLQIGSQQNQRQTGYGQQEDNSDLTQQTEDNRFGKLQFGSQQNRQQPGYGQQEDDSDLTQQTEDNRFGKLQIGSQSQQQTTGFGQQEDNSDLTQQTEDTRFGKLQIGSQQNQRQTGYGQQEDNSDLTQQTEDNRFGKLQFGSQQNRQQPGYGQQEDDSDLTQQTEDNRFGKLQIGSQSQQQTTGFGQQEDNSDLTQQFEDDGFGKLQSGSQQSPEQRDLNFRYPQRPSLNPYLQRAENTGYGHLHFGSQIQQQNHRGDQELTQQQDELKITQQLKDELSKQLKDAVRERVYSTSYYGSNSIQRERIYQNLNNELHRNITRQLQAFASSRGTSSSQSYRLSSQQWYKIQRTLDTDLNLELQEKLNKINRNKLPDNLEQQTRQENNIDLTQQNENPDQLEQINPDLTQQAQTSDLTQKTEDERFERQPEANNQQNNSQLNLNSNQAQFQQRVENILYFQLKNAVRTKYFENYGSFSKRQYYQQLLDELKRNITNELQRATTGRDSYSTYSFNKQELVRLNQQIQSDLKIQLQQQISLYDQQRNVGQINENLGSLEPGIEQQIGQEPVASDLTQQVEDQNLDNYQKNDLTQQSVDLGRLQIGNQGTTQQPISLNILDQQVSGNIRPPQQTEGQQILQQPQFSQDRDSTQLTQEQLDLTQQIDNNYRRPFQVPSANLQFSGRPVTRKPIDSNKFIETEVDQQQQQNILNGNSQNRDNLHNLPTLNQVLEQNQARNNEEYNNQSPSKIEPLDSTPDLTQQVVDINADTDLANTEQTLQNTQNPNRLVLTGVNKPQTPQSSESQTVGVTSQGQIFTQAQSTSDAERNADLLIQKLREHSRNNPNHPQYGSSYADLNQPYGQVLQTEVQDNGRYSPATESSAYGHGPNPIYTPYQYGVNYGQPGQIEQNSETTSDLKPLNYQHAIPVQNVESQAADNNIGVKGRRNRPYSGLPPSPPRPISVIPPQPPQNNISPQAMPPQPGDIPAETPPEPPTLPESESANVPNENLPWWKRFGNKVKQGAQNIKEKYIG